MTRGRSAEGPKTVDGTSLLQSRPAPSIDSFSRCSACYMRICGRPCCCGRSAWSTRGMRRTSACEGCRQRRFHPCRSKGPAPLLSATLAEGLRLEPTASGPRNRHAWRRANSPRPEGPRAESAAGLDAAEVAANHSDYPLFSPPGRTGTIHTKCGRADFRCHLSTCPARRAGTAGFRTRNCRSRRSTERHRVPEVQSALLVRLGRRRAAGQA